jgi:hypothetical protein
MSESQIRLAQSVRPKIGIANYKDPLGDKEGLLDIFERNGS